MLGLSVWDRSCRPWTGLVALVQKHHGVILQGSSVERSGAAQGLAEAFAALGPAHLDALLPSILAQCTVKQAAIREGHMTLLKFLPVALPDSFQVAPSERNSLCCNM